MKKETLLKYTLYIGLNDKDTKQQEINTIDCYKIISKLFESCTISECTGIYKHDDGTCVIEKSLRVEIIDFKRNININEKIDLIKNFLNQESIIKQTEEITSEML